MGIQLHGTITVMMRLWPAVLKLKECSINGQTMFILRYRRHLPLEKPGVNHTLALERFCGQDAAHLAFHCATRRFLMKEIKTKKILSTDKQKGNLGTVCAVI